MPARFGGSAARLRGGELGYRDAVRMGMYRPLGEGDAEIGTVLGLLRDAGYDGWYVIEQDLVLGSERDGGAPLANARRSVRFLAGDAAA